MSNSTRKHQGETIFAVTSVEGVDIIELLLRRKSMLPVRAIPCEMDRSVIIVTAWGTWLETVALIAETVANPGISVEIVELPDVPASIQAQIRDPFRNNSKLVIARRKKNRYVPYLCDLMTQKRSLRQ